jgi:hypothetical protein
MELEVEFHDVVVDHNDFLDLNEVLLFFSFLWIECLVTNGPTRGLLIIGWKWWIEPFVLGFRILSKCIHDSIVKGVNNFLIVTCNYVQF